MNLAKLRISGIQALQIALTLVLILMSFGAQARAPDDPGAGVLLLAPEPGKVGYRALPLTTHYEVKVGALLADTQLTQTFKNTHSEPLEARYVFPLPHEAAVYGMELQVGQRLIEGRIREREAAHQDYTAARDRGERAALVTQQRPNLFTTHIANILPGESVQVRLRYQQQVRYRDGGFELVLPTTLTPRYMPGAPLTPGHSAESQWQSGWARPTSEVPDAGEISPFMLPPALTPGNSHRATLKLTLHAGLPLAEVSSPSHAINPVWVNEPGLNGSGDQVEIDLGPVGIPMDRDFVARWTPALGGAPTAALFHERHGDRDYVLLMLLPALEGAMQNQALARELIFVIDVSGSMKGLPLRQAKAALLRGLDTLGPDDRFNVVSFNHQTRTLFDQARPASGATLAQARDYLQGLEADGGTEMSAALSTALSTEFSTAHSAESSAALSAEFSATMHSRRDAPGAMDAANAANTAGAAKAESSGNGRVRQVLFITDGAVGNEAALLRQIHQDLKGSRLFMVGIGSAPNRHFLRRAAAFGRGTMASIDDPAQVSAAMDALLKRMQSPVLADLQLHWGDNKAETYPQRPGDLYLGEPLVVVARVDRTEGRIEVMGSQGVALSKSGSRSRSDSSSSSSSGAYPTPWLASLDLDQAAPAPGIHRYWARQRIAALIDSEITDADAAAVETAVRETALSHELASPYTSFVALERKPVRDPALPLSAVSVPSLMPAGMASGAIVTAGSDSRLGQLTTAAMPGTATPAPRLLAAGLLVLLVASVLTFLSRRSFQGLSRGPLDV